MHLSCAVNFKGKEITRILHEYIHGTLGIVDKESRITAIVPDRDGLTVYYDPDTVSKWGKLGAK